MRTEIALNGSEQPESRYIGWAPVPATIRLSDRTGVTGPVTVTLRNRQAARGGQVVFLATRPGPAQDTLQLTLPSSGARVSFLVAGRFQRPSVADRDATIDVANVATQEVIGSTPLMVRIRKNATTLSTAERNRFISAFATLNNRGMGRFTDFRNIHTNAGSPEAHGDAGFLPWHRAYLLDLERELQVIDPSVALPYWRFDQPAPRVFSRDFMGVPDAVTGTLQFSPSNPFQFWVSDGTPGIVRRPQFNTTTQSARSPSGGTVLSEAATLALGDPGTRYARFARMEGNPHGTAHISFSGYISGIPTAARDPLFFMLHANVDRLWAKWQWFNRRFDTTATTSFEPQGAAGDPGTTRIGHNLRDTMWPWNQVSRRPRPPTAPGGTMARSPVVAAPGLRPTVGSMIDYQGVVTANSRLGFDYDDVPFEEQGR